MNQFFLVSVEDEYLMMPDAQRRLVREPFALASGSARKSIHGSENYF